jgi:hypothetical protein
MRLRCCAAALALLLAQPGAQAQAGLPAVLARAATYVQTFYNEFGSVVAEERYEQEIRPAVGSNKVARRASGPTRTVLVSDFLLVQIPGEQWLPFRDVFERDGRPVRDRQDRLTALFLSAPASALDQARTIMNESARYNIGDVSRNINIPTFPLQFLSAALQPQFTFSERKRDDAESRVIEYREVGRPTLIRTTNDRDIPAEGRFWIDEETGTVKRSELTAVDTSVEARITVTYQWDETIGSWAPARMEERYKGHEAASEVRGVATYAKFRRFKVTATEDPPTATPPH